MNPIHQGILIGSAVFFIGSLILFNIGIKKDKDHIAIAGFFGMIAAWVAITVLSTTTYGLLLTLLVFIMGFMGGILAVLLAEV